MVGRVMTTTAPTNRIAAEYASFLDKAKTSGRTPTDRYLAAARRLLEEPEELVEIFGSSVQETTESSLATTPATSGYTALTGVS